MGNNLNTLDPMDFLVLPKKREAAIEGASKELPKTDRPANQLAKQLHPGNQAFIVCAVIERSRDCKTFYLTPVDADAHCAWFSAGQYVSVQVVIDGKTYRRPYSLCSSPRETAHDEYAITVKAIEGGIVSNFILNQWTTGTMVILSEPAGTFTYEPLRDAKHIVGLAGGSGITPFYSLAQAIADGYEDCTLTLLYGSRSREDILFEAELRSISEYCEKVRVVHVLSEENCEGYELGLLTEQLIRKYAPDEPYSVFICGPEAMVRFADQELAKLSLERKFIRHEVRGETMATCELPQNDPQTVNISVWVHGERTAITGSSRKTILRTLEENGLVLPSNCRSGECGVCHSRLISGNVFVPESRDRRRQADERYGYIHPCCTYPLGDLEIEIFPADRDGKV